MLQRSRKLLDQVRDAIRLERDAYSTEKTYAYWTKRFVLHHNKRHPLEMGEKEISKFLIHSAQGYRAQFRYCRAGHAQEAGAPWS